MAAVAQDFRLERIQIRVALWSQFFGE
jgi:hypothetical protein